MGKVSSEFLLVTEGGTTLIWLRSYTNSLLISLEEKLIWAGMNQYTQFQKNGTFNSFIQRHLWPRGKPQQRVDQAHPTVEK